MKRLFFTLILLAAALYGSAQTVPVKAKTFQITYGAQTFSINLNGDSVLVSSTNRVWFNKKFGSDTLLFGDGTFMTTAVVPGLTDTGYVKTTGDSLWGTYVTSPLMMLPGDDTTKYSWSSDGLYLYHKESDGSDVITNIYLTADKGLLQQQGSVQSALSTSYLTLTNTSGNSMELGLDNLQFTRDTFSIVRRDTTGTGMNHSMIKFNSVDTSVYISRDLIVYNSLEVNGLVYNSDSTVTSDDAAIVLTNSISGWGEVYAFNAGAIDEWAEFIISSDGTVYLKSNSTDVANTDTDNKLCIFDNGAGVTIRNRLGGTRTIKYIIHH